MGLGRVTFSPCIGSRLNAEKKISVGENEYQSIAAIRIISLIIPYGRLPGRKMSITPAGRFGYRPAAPLTYSVADWISLTSSKILSNEMASAGIKEVTTNKVIITGNFIVGDDEAIQRWS